MIQTFARLSFPTAIILLLGVAPAGPTLAVDIAAPAPVSVAPTVAPTVAIEPGGGDTAAAAPLAHASPVAAARPMPVAATAPPPPLRGAASLKPGRFVWQPERAETGPVELVVSIPLQRAYVYRGGTLIGVTTVSTGRKGHPTPLGRFDILEKRRTHFSNRYDNAPMPFMQRLTWDGIALHAGAIPGRPASHGCIRLPLAFARQLFRVTRVGASVHILASSPAPDDALAMVHSDVRSGVGSDVGARGRETAAGDR